MHARATSAFHPDLQLETAEDIDPQLEIITHGGRAILIDAK